MQEWVRQAASEKLLSDEVDLSDPIFSAFPRVARQGPKIDVLTRHDECFYGPLK